MFATVFVAWACKILKNSSFAIINFTIAVIAAKILPTTS
jgi:hypothetical protein